MKKNLLAKAVSLAMACTMLTGTVISTAVTVYADTLSGYSLEQGDERMKAAVEEVKKRVNITPQLSEFYWESTNKYKSMFKSEYEDDAYWFRWATPDDADIPEEISMLFADDMIVMYESSDNEDDHWKSSLAKLSADQLLSKAKEHMKKLNPDIYDEGVYSIAEMELSGYEVQIKFERRVNGIPVPENWAEIHMSKNTGKLLFMRLNWWKNAEFQSPDTKLTEAEAIERFKELCKLEKSHYSVGSESAKNNLFARLIYKPSFNSLIDAFTGEISYFWEECLKKGGVALPDFQWFYVMNYQKGDGVADIEDPDDSYSDELTRIDYETFEGKEEFLTVEQITDLLRKDKYIKLSHKAELYEDRIELFRNERTGEYIYSLYYRSPYYEVDVDVNAHTGRIEFFSRKNLKTDYDKTKLYPKKSNYKLAKEIIKQMYPDIYSQFIPDEKCTSPVESWEEDGVIYYDTTHYYYFERYVNDTRMKNDYIGIRISNTGDILHISYNYTDAKFQTAGEFDEDKAIDSLFRQQEMELYYDGWRMPDGSVKTNLVYSTDKFYMDADYKLCGHWGNIDKKNLFKTDYTDIKGSKYENAIRKLADHGIILESKNGRFEPDRIITDLEFSAVVYKAMKSYVPTEISNAMKENKGQALTKAYAANVLINLQDGKEYAELDIYSSPYSDVPADHQYAGCISIATALGIFKSGGKFEPDRKLTRGEAMQLIYDYIKIVTV